MHDKFGQLLRDGTRQLGQHLTPAPAHLVRARGNRRLRRNAAGTTVLIVALIAASGGGAYALSQQPHAAPSVAAPKSPAPASATTAPAMVVTVCLTPAGSCAPSQMQAEPLRMDSKADGTMIFTGITWSDWGTSTAIGTGTMALDNCDPNCASGTYTDYPATVTLSGLTQYASGTEGYSTIVFSAPTSPGKTTIAFTTHTLPTTTG